MTLVPGNVFGFWMFVVISVISVIVVYMIRASQNDKIQVDIGDSSRASMHLLRGFSKRKDLIGTNTTMYKIMLRIMFETS